MFVKLCVGCGKVESPYCKNGQTQGQNILGNIREEAQRVARKWREVDEGHSR